MSCNMQMRLAEWETVVPLHHDIIKKFIYLEGMTLLCLMCFCGLLRLSEIHL
jgi:hypothetical protein